MIYWLLSWYWWSYAIVYVVGLLVVAFFGGRELGKDATVFVNVSAILWPIVVPFVLLVSFVEVVRRLGEEF